ncbi:MAG: ABC transporter permease [Prevotellaceae bacterium]|nr:ABC transporter permease [Prevotellaceae bacterium]
MFCKDNFFQKKQQNNLLRKEFKQLFRNSFIPKMLFGFPLMVLLILPWAASYEINNLNLSIVDHDHSTYSRQLTEKILSSGYFRLTDNATNFHTALKSIERKESDLILEIPPHFEKNLITGQGTKLMIAPNAVNGMKAGVGMTYLSSIIADFNAEIVNELVPANRRTAMPTIQIDSQFKFNPRLNYRVYMVPALIVLILTLICGFLPGVSIVLEKEIGTMEQINVSPVNKGLFLLAKLIPFWVIGFVILTFGEFIAWAVYGLVPAGHYYTIYLFATIYIITVSGLGLIISNYAQTMQQAMFIVFFFMLIFIMLSGLYTPVESMPEWAQWIAAFNPLKHFMVVMRSVFLKGSGLADLTKEIWALLGFAVFFNSWAVFSYRKVDK